MSKAKVEQKLMTLLTVFTIIVLFWGQIGQSYLALGGAKLRKSSKVEFIGANSDFGGANSDFGGVEMVPVPPVLAQIVQNEPRWAKLALMKLGPIWLLGSIWLFSFYSVCNSILKISASSSLSSFSFHTSRYQCHSSLNVGSSSINSSTTCDAPFLM